MNNRFSPLILTENKRKLKKKYNLEDYNSLEAVEKVISVVEEFLGDCSDMIAKRVQEPV